MHQHLSGCLFLIMAEICKPGDPVTWEAMASLALKFKNLGSRLGLTGYQPIADDTNSPFSVDTPERRKLTMTYDVFNGTIQRAYLAEELLNSTPWKPLDYQIAMVDSKDLVFVSEADGCLCRSMWDIVQALPDYTLGFINDLALGCCPSLELPVVGASAFNHPFFPSLKVKSSDFSGWVTLAACAGMEGGAAVLYQDGRVIKRQRELTGAVTWKIRKRFYDELLEEMAELVRASGRLKNRFDIAYFIRSAGKCDAGSWFPGPIPSEDVDCVRNAVAGILTQAFALSTGTSTVTVAPSFDSSWWSEPGCLDISDSDDPTWIRPWEQPTCLAERCEGELRVYCNTMRWMHALVDATEYALCRGEGAAPTWGDVDIDGGLLGPGGTMTIVKGTGFATDTTITVTLPDVCPGTDTPVIAFISVSAQCGNIKVKPAFEGTTGKAKTITGPEPEDCFDSSTPPDAWLVSGPDTYAIVGATPDSCDWCGEAADASVLFGSLGEVELVAGGAALAINMPYGGYKPATHMVWTLRLTG